MSEDFEQMTMDFGPQAPYEMSPIFSVDEFNWVLETANERHVPWKQMVHDAAMADLYR